MLCSLSTLGNYDFAEFASAGSSPTFSESPASNIDPALETDGTFGIVPNPSTTKNFNQTTTAAFNPGTIALTNPNTVATLDSNMPAPAVHKSNDTKYYAQQRRAVSRPMLK